MFSDFCFFNEQCVVPDILPGDIITLFKDDRLQSRLMISSKKFTIFFCVDSQHGGNQGGSDLVRLTWKKRD